MMQKMVLERWEDGHCPPAHTHPGWVGGEDLIAGRSCGQLPESPTWRGQAGGQSRRTMLLPWGGSFSNDDSMHLKTALHRVHTDIARDGAAHSYNVLAGEQQRAVNRMWTR